MWIGLIVVVVVIYLLRNHIAQRRCKECRELMRHNAKRCPHCTAAVVA